MPRTTGHPAPTPVFLAAAVTDSVTLRRGVGAILVYVRTAVPGAFPIEAAEVVVRDIASASRKMEALTDRSGYVRFDDVSSGRYTIRVRRIGMAVEQWEIVVGAGCENAIEVRLALQANCLFDCPPARVPPLIFSCAPGGKEVPPPAF